MAARGCVPCAMASLTHTRTWMAVVLSTEVNSNCSMVTCANAPADPFAFQDATRLIIDPLLKSWLRLARVFADLLANCDEFDYLCRESNFAKGVAEELGVFGIRFPDEEVLFV